jgi:DedD protein
MSLFSSLRKNKQESASGDSEFYSRAEEESANIRSRSKRRQGKESTASADPVLPEKKRARRRLVGAVALVLAAVIGLPMVLDSEPKSLDVDIAIQIPSQDQAQPLAGTRGPAVGASMVAASDALDQKEEVLDTPVVTTTSMVTSATREDPIVEKETAPAARKPETSKSVPVEKNVAAATTKITDRANDKLKPAKVDAKAAMPQLAKLDDTSRALAILEGKFEPKVAAANASSDKKSDKFIVQVAALASKEKTDELQDRLRKAGIATYTQKVATESGNRTRIRIGPFASKEDAEQMRVRLSKLHLNGTVVPASH